MKKNVMRPWIFILLLACGPWAVCSAQDVKFSKYFSGGTLRLDCVREGNRERDTVWVERWLDRSAEWHGSRTRLTDPFNNGEYRVEMRDGKSGKVLYSRGYSNLFREWRNTEEGKHGVKRFEETVLLPMPKKAVKIAFQHRVCKGREGYVFEDQTVVDFVPGQRELEFNYRIGEAVELELHGAPAQKVAVVIVAQGYNSPADPQLRVDYYRLKENLFGQEPFASHREDFNVYGVFADVDADYNTFGADRYLMTFSLWKLHDRLGTTPCDQIIIMVNNEKYGGGAIYNFYAVTSLNGYSKFVLPHELGHSFGGLADEYVDEELSYGDIHVEQAEPQEPNITNLKDFDSKWKSMLPPGTPVPTPDAQVSRNECGPLGVYEGAGYASKGVYRPAMHCMMRDYAPFCPVCRQRLEDVFKLYTQ